MKQLTCEMCGSTDIIKQDGVFVCQTCGCKYSVEEAKKMMIEGTVDVSGSTVKVDNSGLIDSYLQMAENALNAQNNAEAENYSNKIIEIDPKAYKAWFIKGKASGWQTTGRNNRYPESIVNWINAYEFAPDDKKESLAALIKTEAEKISLAVLQMECNHFSELQVENNYNDIVNILPMIEKQLGELKTHTGIDVYTNSFKTRLAQMLNGCVVNAANDAEKDFGQEKDDRTEYKWRKYVSAQDWNMDILDRAYKLTDDDDLCYTICDNYIYIGERTRDSCSYKLNIGSYGYRSYDVEWTLTNEAKNNRSKIILQWKEKKQQHDPNRRKRACEDAIKAAESAYGDSEKDMAIKLYWEEHASEKALLNSERSSLEEKLAGLHSKIDNNEDKKELESTEKLISELFIQKDGLGFFKGKEKKALQDRIDSLIERKIELKSRWEPVEKELTEEVKKANSRIKEIDNEFTKDRGVIKSAPKETIVLFENGEYIPTAMEFLNYNRAVMPTKFGIKGDGEEALENFSRTLWLKLEGIKTALLNAAGKKDDTDKETSGYKDDPTKTKIYRISFTSGNDDTQSYLAFKGKDKNSRIEGDVQYWFDGEKTAESVGMFIQIVVASLSGICPEQDRKELQKAIAEASFGIKSETELSFGYIELTVTGNTKNNTYVKLNPKDTKCA